MVEDSLVGKYLDGDKHFLTGFHKTSILKMMLIKNNQIRYFPAIFIQAGEDCCVRNTRICLIEDFEFTMWSKIKLWFFKIRNRP